MSKAVRQNDSNLERASRKSTEFQFHVIYLVAMICSISCNLMILKNDGILENGYLHTLKPKYNTTNPIIPRDRNLIRDVPFSACMLIMDDNHRLSEWIAYHYHVLRLRYLVVGIDPNSRTSPSKILERWRTFGMTIIDWNNTDIFDGRLWEYEHVIMKRPRKPHDHRQRQNMFVRNCLVHMKMENRTWVLILDSDEYLLYNGPENAINKFANLRYPSLQEEGSILKFLERHRHFSYGKLDSPCLSIPRMLFGAVDSKKNEMYNKVPESFNPKFFDTLRYRKHIRRSVTHKMTINGWSKSIIDVSRIEWTEFPSLVEAFKTNGWQINIHEPMPKVCVKPFVKDNETVFRINHYVGSWKAFSYRMDARKSEGRDKEKWKLKANQRDETDDNIRPWLQGFVKEHGVAKAKEMLSDVGVFA
jgi:hypothetical protein